LAALAESIVRSAATRVRSGGRLVFAVCSVLEAESEALVQRVRDILEPVAFDCPELRALWSPGQAPSAFRIGPSEFATDGYFAASFVKR